MQDITAASRLLFFKAEHYRFSKTSALDTSHMPRPQFCLGLVLSGHAVYHDCIKNRDVEVGVGDMIFVPIGSRYISSWQGTPDIEYISLHFVFDHTAVFTAAQDFTLQKVVLADFEATKAVFLHALQHFEGDEAERLAVLGNFYALLAKLLPSLARGAAHHIDERIYRAISYIEAHYREEITVEALAQAASVSPSRFFPLFRTSMHLSPVEYIHHYRINRAIILLMSSEHYSIEEISEATGFQSSAYFRRVFKKITGRSPRDYRAAGIEG